MLDELLTGRLHLFLAFDWGEEIDLARAKQQRNSVYLDMRRRPRTPASIAYRVPPLRFTLDPVVISLEGLNTTEIRTAEATVFDFGGVSVSLAIPFTMTRAALRDLAAKLTDRSNAQTLVKSVRNLLEPLYRQLLPAIVRPDWPETLWEEYFVFQFSPGSLLVPEQLLKEQSGWMAGLIRLEDEELSDQEVAEALRLRMRYTTYDLFVPDWAAAVLVDREEESAETLQAVEFANLQLLEYRHIDARLDGILNRAEQLLGRSGGQWLPFFGTDRSVRLMGELKVEANRLFERTGNVLKLVGDQYISRVYRMLSTRFHLPEWERSISHKLEVLEGVYTVLADQSQHFRSEILEVLVVILILTEIAISIFKH
ncbi:MAG: hypothetical protein EBV06_11095 [Planctomycetia bacterium]|nr:hypothetical protein [Planctomycetia bacterium]